MDRTSQRRQGYIILLSYWCIYIRACHHPEINFHFFYEEVVVVNIGTLNNIGFIKQIAAHGTNTARA